MNVTNDNGHAQLQPTLVACQSVALSNLKKSAEVTG